MVSRGLPTFEEFRREQADALRAQEEALRDDAHAAAVLAGARMSRDWLPWPPVALLSDEAAEAILRDASRQKGWVVWEGNALAIQR
jgi:hypothetical protein